MIKTDIQADSKYPVDRKRIRSLVERVLGEHGIVENVQVSISIVGDRKMKFLNQNYKKHEGTTDVLSFPYTESVEYEGKEVGFVIAEELGLMLGDIIVSYPQAVKQAGEKDKLVDDEVDFLVEHGLLHLLGIHHD